MTFGREVAPDEEERKGRTPPVEYVVVGRPSEFREGVPRTVRAGDRQYVVVRLGEELHALSNDCPHNGGPLGKGRLLGCELECPWHGWRWDVRTGRSTWPATSWLARKVPVQVQDDTVRLPLL